MLRRLLVCGLTLALTIDGKCHRHHHPHHIESIEKLFDTPAELANHVVGGLTEQKANFKLFTADKHSDHHINVTYLNQEELGK